MTKNLRRIEPIKNKNSLILVGSASWGDKHPLDEVLAFQFKALKIDCLKREYRFHPKRRWRLDFADVPKKIAIECEGGIYSRGRHTRGKGFENDCEKYNQLAIMGWRLLRFTRKHIEDGTAIKDYLGMK